MKVPWLFAVVDGDRVTIGDRGNAQKYLGDLQYELSEIVKKLDIAEQAGFARFGLDGEIWCTRQNFGRVTDFNLYDDSCDWD